MVSAVLAVEMIVDRLLEVGDAPEDAAPDALGCDLGLSHDALVGVKCSLKRRCRTSHAFTSGAGAAGCKRRKSDDRGPRG
jgi:hypothetical protein